MTTLLGNHGQFANSQQAIFNPTELFGGGEQGLWLDPSDMTAGKAGWRRNLLSYTEQFDVSGTWGVGAVSVAANNATAPDGTTTADTVTESATTDYHRLNNGNISRTSGITYTLSVYAKLGTGARFLIINSASAINAMAAFNLSTGAVHSTTSGSAAIQSVGSGWYRCSVTGTATITGTSTIYFQLDDNGTDGTYAGDGSSSLLLWGAQLELGSSASTYQPITDFSTEFKAAFPTHTLYQDSNGVTPCTAAGDPVGLILDQSRGGLSQIGTEVVSNGGFTTDTAWTKGTGWSISGGVATITNPDVTNRYIQQDTVTGTPGKWYRVTIDVISLGTGSVQIRLGSGASAPGILTASTTGTHTLIGLWTGITSTIFINGTTTSGTYTIDNVSIKELPGNHAYQTTSASRPTLARIPVSGRRNLLTRTEEFDNAAWTKAGGSVSANQIANPVNGELTADLLTEDSALNNHGFTVSYTAANVPYTAFVYVKYDSHPFFEFSIDILDGNAYAVFNITDGTVSFSGAGAVAAITSLGSGWYRCAVTYTPTAGAKTLRFRFGTDAVTFYYTGNGTRKSYIWGAQLETGSTATNYQKVVATTDVTESGFGDLWHLVFDGSDDSLVTNSVNFSGTAEMAVIAGVRKLSDAAIGVVVELSSNSGNFNGSFMLTACGQASAGAKYGSTLRGSALIYSDSPASYTAPITNVVSLLSDISQSTAADEQQMRINGTQVALTTVGSDAGTANWRGDVLYIGRRGGTTLPYNGHLYQLIIRGKTTPTGKLLEAERFVSKKTGVNI